MVLNAVGFSSVRACFFGRPEATAFGRAVIICCGIAPWASEGAADGAGDPGPNTFVKKVSSPASGVDDCADEVGIAGVVSGCLHELEALTGTASPTFIGDKLSPCVFANAIIFGT